MKEIYKEAFSEVDEIFKLMPTNLLNKIPAKFRKMINSEKSMNYNPIIREPIEDFVLKEETIVILALIYRDFLCSSEEKEKLKLRDAEKIREAEEELRKKYNPDNIFKNRTNLSNDLNDTENSTTAIVEYKEKNFIQKIFEKVKHLFKKNY